MPNMADVLGDWQQDLKVKMSKKTVTDFAVVETPISTMRFRGALLPMSGQKIRVKPEGQRRWKWWTLVTVENMNLDDIVLDASGREFRVMGKTDWSQANFYEYELQQAPYGA